MIRLVTRGCAAAAALRRVELQRRLEGGLPPGIVAAPDQRDPAVVLGDRRSGSGRGGRPPRGSCRRERAPRPATRGRRRSRRPRDSGAPRRGAGPAGRGSRTSRRGCRRAPAAVAPCSGDEGEAAASRPSAGWCRGGTRAGRGAPRGVRASSRRPAAGPPRPPARARLRRERPLDGADVAVVDRAGDGARRRRGATSRRPRRRCRARRSARRGRCRRPGKAAMSPGSMPSVTKRIEPGGLLVGEQASRRAPAPPRRCGRRRA